MSDSTHKKLSTPDKLGDGVARSGGVSDAPTILWQQLTECLEAFAAAWQDAPHPPALRDYLPALPSSLRWLALVELVKVDLERRWSRSEWRWPLERYAAEFPELSADGVLPNDLIYEEIHVRRQAGEVVSLDEYRTRFPEQIVRLDDVLAIDRPALTTALRQLPNIDDFDAGQRVDDFDLLLPLGRGAFGSVFLARQCSLGRLVALKIAADQGFEMQTLAQLDHPYIVRVFDQRALPQRRLQLIYMQYVPGGTLDEVVKRVRRTPAAQRGGKLLLACIDERLNERADSPPTDSRTRQYLVGLGWPETVCWLGARIAEALEHAHTHGVLHRDLKPANVLLAADGHPRLADFNVSSCAAVPGANAAVFFGGSLAYMSPEQLDVCLGGDRSRAEPLDERSDLFTLGVLLWELLTGERPFGDDRQCDMTPASLERMAERRRQELSEDAVRTLPADCPPHMIEVLHGLLQPDRERRMSSARGVQRQLDLCLRPDVERLARPRRAGMLAVLGRHPWPLLIAAGVLPNMVLGALNIAYNAQEILRHVQDPEVLHVFKIQIVVVNLIAYVIGAGIPIALAWPVVRAVRRCLTAADPGEASRWRERSLMLGRYIARVSGVEWLISGLVFPAWLQFALKGPIGLDARQYVHFFGSQSLCGLLAATTSFFLATSYSLRVLTPALLDPDHDDPSLGRALDRLSMATGLYTRLTSVAVPMALILMPLVPSQSRWTFFVLGLVGLFAWRLATVLSQHIQRSIRALQSAASVSSAANNSSDGAL
ncbi:MAG TPA: serine/threonine-protein kinase [Pirellulales bacterium]|nr:serine/threonine-protein kinase [Pirellulales bacterium]